MKKYNWLNDSYKRIINFFKKNKAHHALLIQSFKGNGELYFLYSIAMWLICKKKNNTKYCNKCKDCKLMKVGYHPDFYQLGLKSNIIGIDDIRSLKKLIYNYSYKEGYKVIFIPHTEILTEYAENSLLKILEEPPKNTFFLMGCQQPLNLLPSFRSRCFKFYLSIPNEKYGILWLKKEIKFSLQEIKTSLRLNNGCILNAKKLLISEEWNKRKFLCESIYKSINNKDFLSILPIFTKKNNENVTWWFISLLIDSLKWKKNIKKFLVNVDQIELINKLSNYYDIKILFNHIKEWIKYYKINIIVNGVNKELLIMYCLSLLE
ncbi:DNA polymerase III subunit delta' C-terminal domain-containing protein [Sodalis-like secondary symbiont of Drepanosiphum platanoidis]|uniref:DNA polymerase III subunit delta' C-terminal domain-containing protein n=1 Tax=Sodalis-like secondary symbiont of Drepanosiphum platanoidis TaxID=2994493 RepID=UPI003463EF74